MSFFTVHGQGQVIKILQDELKADRVKHAYLFNGQAGVGKFSLGREFAKAILCLEDEIDSCGKCINCRKVKHHNHPDVKYIQPEADKSSIGIDQIRQLQKEIAYKPYEGSHKIYLIKEADKLTEQAANSLLKTLEEPPPFAVIILLVEELSRILPTVISRCQLIRLRDLTNDEIIDILLKGDISKTRANLLAKLAEGSPGKALQLAENEELLAQREKLYNFLAKIKLATTVDIFNAAASLDSFYKNGFPLFDLLSNWYHDIIMIKRSCLQNVKNEDFSNLLSEQANNYQLKEVFAGLDLLNQFREYLERNVRSELAIQVLLFKLRSLN